MTSRPDDAEVRACPCPSGSLSRRRTEWSAETGPRSRRSSLLAIGLLPILGACSDQGLGPPEEVSPTVTGFEERSGLEFTTHSEELAFLAAVDAESDRVRITEVGTSVRGRPIHLVRLGYPEPAPDDQIAAGPSLLVVGAQHGNEPAGREAALQFLRDLALDEASLLPDALSTATVLVIPTANPDGRVANTRRNADNVDINRDHLALVSPEARTIAQVIRDFRPDLVVDAHERGATTPDLQLLWPRNLNVYGPVRDLSRALVEDHLFDQLPLAGYSVELYGAGPGGAGGEDERMLRNTVGLRHALGLLVESSSQLGAPLRAAAHQETMNSVLKFFWNRSSEIVTAVTAAPGAKEATGRERSEPFYLFGADDNAPTPDQILDPPPCAYALSTEQVTTLQSQITLLELQTETDGSGVLVRMDQPMMTVVPFLVDAGAREPRVTGVARVPAVECGAP
ncbi:MAG: M14 family zinc carboxypeptidase [Longimicrobiales bacterium]|nr:M14 family zinc carboxypeptidase [Longimicrobiales bacterium]